MNMNEILTLAAWLLAPAFFSMLGMAAFGSPAISLLGELAAKAKKRVFYDKYGQQVASMGLILLILMLTVSAIANTAAYIKMPQLFQTFLTPTSPLIYALYGLGGFFILSVTYYLTWKKMRNAKALHSILGFLAAGAGLGTVGFSVIAKLTIGLAMTQADTAVSPILLPMAAMYTILTLTAASALSCGYLLARRTKDDFGRDYYNFSLKLAARWAVVSMFAFLGCQGWLFAVMPEAIKLMTMGTPLAIVWGAAAGLGLICLTLWFLIARSQSPLQLKGLAVIAIILFWLMHTMNATLFVSFMSMP